MPATKTTKTTKANSAKTAKPAKAKPDGKMSAIDAAAKVLAVSAEPMN